MKKENVIYAALILVASFILFPTIAFIINSLLDRKMSIIELKENSTFKYFVSLIFDKEVIFSYIIFNPINVAFWGITLIGIFLILLKGITTKEKDKFEQVENYGSHGSSRFMTNKEIKTQFYNRKPGWFLGSLNEKTFELNSDFAVHGIENAKELNMQVNVIGPPGSKKTTGLLFPNIFYLADIYEKSDEKADIIVTDPKGEILELTGNYLKEKNYDIKVIDFLHLKYGDSVNPLSYITEQTDIMKIARGFVEAAGMKTGKTQNTDPIWDSGETLLLAALITFVLEVYEKEDHTFEKVSQILGSPVIRDYDKAEKLFKRHGVKGYGEELWNKFLNLEDKVRSGVVGGLSIKMALFSLDAVKRITRENTFDFSMLGTKKERPMAVFIQMPDEDRTFSPIINTMISMMFKSMYATARLHNNRLPNPVYMILEEIANIGKLPGIEELLGTMRGRRIYPMMIWQDLVQMKGMFGDAWEGIVGKCDTFIYLGGNDQTTLKYVSDKLGKTTIRTQGKSSKDEGIMTSGKSISESYNQRPLLYPEEVERLDNDLLIVIQRSNNPFLLNKAQYRYWENPITERLTVDELPLLSRFDTSIEPEVEELFNEEVNFDEPTKIVPIVDDVQETEVLEETIEIEEEIKIDELPIEVDIEIEVPAEVVIDIEEELNEDVVDFQLSENPIK